MLVPLKEKWDCTTRQNPLDILSEPKIVIERWANSNTTIGRVRPHLAYSLYPGGVRNGKAAYFFTPRRHVFSIYKSVIEAMDLYAALVRYQERQRHQYRRSHQENVQSRLSTIHVRPQGESYMHLFLPDSYN